MMGWRSVLAAGALALGLAIPAPAGAAVWEDAGWGVLTIVANACYMPAKFVYATAGAITGTFAYAITGGDMAVADDVWGPSLGGDYVLTPQMMRGEEAITFAAFDDPSAKPEETPPAESSAPISEERLGSS